MQPYVMWQARPVFVTSTFLDRHAERDYTCASMSSPRSKSACASVEMHRPIRGMSKAAEQAIADYRWPGNVRELRSVMRQAVLRAAGSVIDVSDFCEAFKKPRRRYAIEH